MELADNSSLSDFTKKTLAQFGWKDKDPIPADLGSLMVSLRETLPPSKNFDVLVDATLLNETQVAQIKDMLAQAKVAQKEKDAKEQKEKEQAKLFANMPPSLAESFKQVIADNPQIIDDRDSTPAVQPADVENTAAPVTKEPTTVKPAQEPTSALVAAGNPQNCPRCGWDMKQKFEITPTDADKEAFLISLLGGHRFKRTYELFGGKVRVTFRSMLAEENKAIYRQLVMDQQAKKIATEAEWFVQLMDYRLACSLDEMTTQEGLIVATIPEVTLVSPLPENDDDNPLVRQLQQINKDVLAQEITRRLVGAHLRRFQRLLETLEAQALDPSFWQGIA